MQTSHVMNLCAPENASKQEEDIQESDQFSTVSSSSSEEEEEEEKNDVASGAVDSAAVAEESEEDKPSRQNATSKRKSRVLVSAKVLDAPTTTEESVAYCLMMLSRGKWEEEEEEEEEEEGNGDYFSGEYSIIKVKRSNKVGGKYRCETCRKMFRSYQALGGHRASGHGKVKAAAAALSAAVGVDERIYECPFCHRVFPTGQALGGHKRSHFVGASAISRNIGAISAIKQFSRNGETRGIDFNLPAPSDDDYD